MRDLAEFLKNKKTDNAQKVEQNSANKNADFAGNQRVSQDMSSPADIINAFSGKSKDELMQTLIGEVNKKKASGTFDPNEMDDFAARVAPMLNSDAREELANILSLLKQ